MKIIISHDVDHLYPSDHFFKDLIFQKLWIRSFIGLLRGKISFKCFFYRFLAVFDRRMNRIPEIITFDKSHNIPSTFFFGMANILGMSYSIKKAIPWMNYVRENNLDIGVHGVDFENPQKEFDTFKQITGLKYFGIRTHYVRYNDETFSTFAKTGYVFDCSEFNKQEISFKDVYRVGVLWEFPLHIMESYILKNGFDQAINMTMKALQEAETKDINYFCFLFHDYMYNEKTYPIEKKYYEWFIDFCETQKYHFISYRLAIEELNSK